MHYSSNEFEWMTFKELCGHNFYILHLFLIHDSKSLTFFVLKIGKIFHLLQYQVKHLIDIWYLFFYLCKFYDISVWDLWVVCERYDPTQSS